MMTIRLNLLFSFRLLVSPPLLYSTFSYLVWATSRSRMPFGFGTSITPLGYVINAISLIINGSVLAGILGTWVWAFVTSLLLYTLLFFLMIGWDWACGLLLYPYFPSIVYILSSPFFFLNATRTLGVWE